MNSLILTIRALSVEFARRLVLPVFIIGLSVLVLLIVGAVWLTTISGWWGILLGVLIVALLIFIAISIIVKIFLGIIKPVQTKSQQSAVKSFVDKLQEISDIVQTPKAFLLGRIVWDTVSKNNSGLVYTVSTHTTTTKKDFDAIRSSFESTSK